VSTVLPGFSPTEREEFTNGWCKDIPRVAILICVNIFPLYEKYNPLSVHILRKPIKNNAFFLRLFGTHIADKTCGLRGDFIFHDFYQ
jgi:hypothetical protein